VGAGALVTEGKMFPPRSLILGSPARKARDIGDAEVAEIVESAESYIGLALKAAEQKTALYKSDNVRHT